MGRPPTRPKRLKNGFYIEVRSKGATSGMRIWNETNQEMLDKAEFYRNSNKEVVVLGEHKNDIWLNQEAAERKEKEKARQQKLEIRARINMEKLEEKAAAKAAKDAAKAEKPAKPAKAVKPVKSVKPAKSPKKVKNVKPAKAAKAKKPTKSAKKK